MSTSGQSSKGDGGDKRRALLGKEQAQGGGVHGEKAGPAVEICPKEPLWRQKLWLKEKESALNYLDKFWDNIFAFLKDGDLPIDNNLAERAIRPLTTQRNSMLHFGSDEGAEMAATYHSIISTVKMQGRSAWEYLGKFFTKIFNGCRDFFSLRPDKIGLAICQ